ncbi:hypothetical protein FA13DRAFT_1794577 [Coprinellus micaceus]|uniref:Uncharacterized protein n=1 Tax=Coprinellus micaceus TaxID=71717 RepID=A0A4Y7T0H2_COPMI|nr:hypothetical protein FA13DRAFT_1794577 [Coprinellus micaceus]
MANILTGIRNSFNTTASSFGSANPSDWSSKCEQQYGISTATIARTSSSISLAQGITDGGAGTSAPGTVDGPPAVPHGESYLQGDVGLGCPADSPDADRLGENSYAWRNYSSRMYDGEKRGGDMEHISCSVQTRQFTTAVAGKSMKVWIHEGIYNHPQPPPGGRLSTMQQDQVDEQMVKNPTALGSKERTLCHYPVIPTSSDSTTQREPFAGTYADAIILFMGEQFTSLPKEGQDRTREGFIKESEKATVGCTVYFLASARRPRDTSSSVPPSISNHSMEPMYTLINANTTNVQFELAVAAIQSDFPTAYRPYVFKFTPSQATTNQADETQRLWSDILSNEEKLDRVVKEGRDVHLTFESDEEMQAAILESIAMEKAMAAKPAHKKSAGSAPKPKTVAAAGAANRARREEESEELEIRNTATGLFLETSEVYARRSFIQNRQFLQVLHLQS